MSFSAVNGSSRPALTMRLTLRIGIVMLTVGAIFSAIYFVLSVSLFSRLAHQQLEQKAKSAEVIVRSVANSRETINSTTLIRNLQNGGFTDHIAVFSDRNKLIAHTDEIIAGKLEQYVTNPKLKLREVEEQNRLLQDVLTYRKARPVSPFYMLDDVNYVAFVQDNITVMVGLSVQKPKC